MSAGWPRSTSACLARPASTSAPPYQRFQQKSLRVRSSRILSLRRVSSGRGAVSIAGCCAGLSVMLSVVLSMVFMLLLMRRRRC